MYRAISVHLLKTYIEYYNDVVNLKRNIFSDIRDGYYFQIDRSLLINFSNFCISF